MAIAFETGGRKDAAKLMMEGLTKLRFSRGKLDPLGYKEMARLLRENGATIDGYTLSKWMHGALVPRETSIIKTMGALRAIRKGSPKAVENGDGQRDLPMEKAQAIPVDGLSDEIKRKIIEGIEAERKAMEESRRLYVESLSAQKARVESALAMQEEEVRILRRIADKLEWICDKLAAKQS